MMLSTGTAVTIPFHKNLSFDIDSYNGLMHTLFTIEDMYGITVDRIDDVVCLHLDKTVSKPGSSLWTYLEDWYSMKNKLGHGRITREEYDEWRYNFPHSGTSEQTVVPPS